MSGLESLEGSLILDCQLLSDASTNWGIFGTDGVNCLLVFDWSINHLESWVFEHVLGHDQSWLDHLEPWHISTFKSTIMRAIKALVEYDSIL